MVVLISVLMVWRSPGRGPRFLTVDGALIASLSLSVMMVCYLFASSPSAASPTIGVGAYLALIGGIVASFGSSIWLIDAPYSPQHPLRPGIGWGRLVGGAIAAIVILVGAVSGWSFDRRTDQVISAETRAKIEALARAGG